MEPRGGHIKDRLDFFNKQIVIAIPREVIVAQNRRDIAGGGTGARFVSLFLLQLGFHCDA